MSKLQPFPVVLEDGQTATMYAASRFLDDRDERLIRTKDGQEFLVPKSHLEPRNDGTYRLRTPLSAFVRSGDRSSDTPRREHPDETTNRSFEGGVIPVLEEQLETRMQEHETGRIRITKSVDTQNFDVDEPVLRRYYNIERVPRDEIIDAPIEPRYEDETLVLPVFEEVLIVEKRLVLREEIRITRRTEEHVQHETVPLRRERVDVERVR